MAAATGVAGPSTNTSIPLPPPPGQEAHITVTFTEKDYELADLNPPVTYRHLLAQNWNVRFVA
jgi:hypothetical protein